MFDLHDFSNKICFIGYNKTATTTIHQLFERNGFKSGHTTTDLDRYQIISDTVNSLDVRRDFIDYRCIERDYPNSVFILNTRSLDGWLNSRAGHYYWRGLYRGDAFGYAVDQNVISLWIESRNTYYKELILDFMDRPDKLVLLDIDNPNWITFLCSLFGLTHHDLHANKSELNGDQYVRNKAKVLNPNNEEISQEYLERIRSSINDSYTDLCIRDMNSCLLIESITDRQEYSKILENIPRFKNNIVVEIQGIWHQFVRILRGAFSPSASSA